MDGNVSMYVPVVIVPKIYKYLHWIRPDNIAFNNTSQNVTFSPLEGLLWNKKNNDIDIVSQIKVHTEVIKCLK